MLFRSDPVTEEMALARDMISVEPRRGEFAANLRRKFERAAFVGVDAEHPIVRRGGEREVAESAKPTELFADDPRVELTATSTVPSVLNESTTMISSAHLTVSSTARIWRTSLSVRV